MTDTAAEPEKSEPAKDLAGLLQLMQFLRSPDGGCPWDREQSFATIAPYTIEEAYEVASAIQEQDWTHLKEELGDLLFQVVFHAQMASERGLFDFQDVAAGIVAKMIARHPHVFAGAKQPDSPAAQTEAWEALKRRERAQKHESLLDDVPMALPALTRAEKLQKRAGSVGFDWENAHKVLDKLSEEAAEVVEAAESGDQAHVEEEMGDLLFVVANLARHLKIDPEEALRKANHKFVRRFRHIEKSLAAAGRTPSEASLEEMEALWQEAKTLAKADRP
jgi:MazG family protein